MIDKTDSSTERHVTPERGRAPSGRVLKTLAIPLLVFALGLVVLSVVVLRSRYTSSARSVVAAESSAPDPTSDPGAGRQPPLPGTMDSWDPVLVERIRTRAEAVRRDPQSADAIGRLGILYEVHGKMGLAAECYARAVDLHRDEPRWKYHGAVVAQVSGDLVGAEAALRDVVSKKADCAPAHERLGLLLFERNAFDEAAECFRRVIGLRPDEAPGYAGLGRVELARGRFQEAAEVLN